MSDFMSFHHGTAIKSSGHFTPAGVLHHDTNKLVYPCCRIFQLFDGVTFLTAYKAMLPKDHKFTCPSFNWKMQLKLLFLAGELRLS